jgi:hypothetical protein
MPWPPPTRDLGTWTDGLARAKPARKKRFRTSRLTGKRCLVYCTY